VRIVEDSEPRPAGGRALLFANNTASSWPPPIQPPPRSAMLESVYLSAIEKGKASPLPEGLSSSLTFFDESIDYYYFPICVHLPSRRTFSCKQREKVLFPLSRSEFYTTGKSRCQVDKQMPGPLFLVNGKERSPPDDAGQTAKRGAPGIRDAFLPSAPGSWFFCQGPYDPWMLPSDVPFHAHGLSYSFARRFFANLFIFF